MAGWYVLGQPLLKPAKHAICDIIQVDTSQARELYSIVPRNIRLDQIMQLRGELYSRRPCTNDAEIEQVATVNIGERGLRRFFEALRKIDLM